MQCKNKDASSQNSECGAVVLRCGECRRAKACLRGSLGRRGERGEPAGGGRMIKQW